MCCISPPVTLLSLRPSFRHTHDPSPLALPCKTKFPHKPVPFHEKGGKLEAARQRYREGGVRALEAVAGPADRLASACRYICVTQLATQTNLPSVSL